MRTDINLPHLAPSVPIDFTGMSMGILTEKKFLLLAQTFKTLGDYSRVRIVWVLLQGEKCPSEIAEAVNLSPSAVSHHLKVLRNSKLVRLRREHRQIFYTLDDDHINKLMEAGIEHVTEILP
ncbi:MAG: ArsR family transcriptional regulator [Bdellovibrionales bacterium]|nr:ArsR family transcriptional regulator [Bdellovibrionales bacterium]